MKKILFDINHPCDINFFKNSLKKLKNKDNSKIFITALVRNPIPRIIEEELADFNVKYIGRHRHTLFSIIFEANILKFFKLLYYVFKIQPDLGVSFGSFVLGGSLKFIGKKNIQFYDDPENKKNLFFQRLTATHLYYPFFFNSNKISKFIALKEWAHLSPKYYTPNNERLSFYGLIPNNYLFIREVSSNTTNYTGQPNNLIASISEKINNNYKVIMSLENKNDRKKYPASWLVINEPEKHIHSLMYYSKIVISSGDSMAREGAILGVPSIYCGIRNMKANDVMIKKGMLFHKKIDEIPNFINFIINNKLNIMDQDKFREKLAQEWADVNEFILARIKDVLNE